MTQNPRVSLIHATPVAIEPVLAAFADSWPEARPLNLLEDALSGDRAAADDLTPALADRIAALSRYAFERLEAEGVLFTCSAFGPAIEAAARNEAPRPVLKPNEAMFEAALVKGGRVGLLATFEPSLASMEDEFEAMRADMGVQASIISHVVPEAMVRLRAGDAEEHNRLLAEASRRLEDCDTVMLAHFSTSRARGAVEAALGRQVLTAPHAAVEALKAKVTDRV